MLDVINESAEADAQLRWMIRRGVVAVVLMIAGYVGPWIPVEYYFKTRSSPAVVQLRPAVLACYRPLDSLRRPPNAMWSQSYYLRNLQDFIQLADEGCQYVDNRAARWAAKGYPVTTKAIIFGLMGLVLAYALSPVPLLWMIKFLGLEQLKFVALLFEWHCAPIEWLNDRSETVRSFYEEYAELFALTH
jgi:hypothetical protein